MCAGDLSCEALDVEMDLGFLFTPLIFSLLGKAILQVPKGALVGKGDNSRTRGTTGEPGTELKSGLCGSGASSRNRRTVLALILKPLLLFLRKPHEAIVTTCTV